MSRLKLLIIGGYGTFGGRLVRLLNEDKDLDILIAGRSGSRARAFAARVGGVAVIRGIELDRQGDLRSAFDEHRPDIVIDASGPFQSYTDHPYRVVESALASGCHYLDLADDRDFVTGIRAFDAAARDAGLFALAGVSSCPALTGAIYRRITRDFAEVDSVFGGIAPSPYSGVGPSVIQAIAGYAGQRIDVRRNGQAAHGHPFTETRQYTVAPPGALPLRSLKYSLVDVPDLTLLAELSPTPATVWFGAAPVPVLYHALFRSLARGVKFGVIRSLAAMAPLMTFVMNRLSWGEHRGGLFLECAGRDHDGRSVRRSWHMVAEGSIGPMTPTLAAVAIVRACQRGQAPAAGARAAHAELELEDFEPMFDELDVEFGERREPVAASTPLFREVLGDAWDRLPKAITGTHEYAERRMLRGHADVIRGRSLIARAIAAVFRFPVGGEHVPVSVEMTRINGTEIWNRDFDGARFMSTLTVGRGRWKNLICERFGLFRFGMALVVDSERLHYVMRRWSVAGVPMPMSLKPKGTTFEAVRDGRFHFDVEITFPILGHVVTYRGWLEPAA